MSTKDILPIGTTVRVHSDVGGSGEFQVIDLHLHKRRGELLYALGHITPRRGLLRRWSKVTKAHHWVSRSRMEVIKPAGES